uniref:BTB/POZ domain-containing protein n=1 Tax=Rhizophora mucronata TaxID=61149 RepID=A0A2P2JAV9_RHIMU
MATISDFFLIYVFLSCLLTWLNQKDPSLTANKRVPFSCVDAAKGPSSKSKQRSSPKNTFKSTCFHWNPSC